MRHTKTLLEAQQTLKALPSGERGLVKWNASHEDIYAVLERSGHYWNSSDQRWHKGDANSRAKVSDLQEEGRVVIREFFLCFTEHMGFQEFDGRSDYEFMLKAARLMKRPFHQIHSDSAKETDPLVDILVITDEPMNRERAEAIDQAATNWLHETGRCWFR